jgi:uncharacterized protein involved in exopolysaccharide biosynthesis
MKNHSLEKQINLRDVWQIAYKRRWLLILPFVLAVAAAYGGSFLLTEKYQSRVQILVKEGEVLGPEFRGIASATGMDAVRTERDLRLWQQSVKSEILSPATLLKVINQMELADDPDVRAEVRELAAKYPQYSERDLINIQLIRKLQDDYVKIGFQGQNVVVISCDSEKPLEARGMAEIMADYFREEQIRADLLSIRAVQEFSTEQLTIYKKEWEDAEAELADFKKSYTRVNVGQKVSEKILDGMTSEIDQTKLYMEDFADQRNFVAVALVDAGVDTSMLVLSEELVGYTSTLSGFTMQKASLMERYPRTDPKVLEVIGRFNRGIDSLPAYCRRTASNLYPNPDLTLLEQTAEYLALSVKIDLAIQGQVILAKTLEKLKYRLTKWPDYEIELERMEQKANTKKDIYLKFNTQLLGSRINEDAFRKEAENRYKIIEPATLPLAPIYPDRFKIVVLGCALGLILGVGAVLLAEVLDNSLRDISETESYLGFKVLGTIPRIAAKRKSPREPNPEPMEIAK